MKGLGVLQIDGEGPSLPHPNPTLQPHLPTPTHTFIIVNGLQAQSRPVLNPYAIDSLKIYEYYFDPT